MRVTPISTSVARARRRRPAVLSLTAACIGLGLLSVAGVFAAATDRATTGTNRVATGDLRELDLQIAERASDGTCGPFSDDLATPLISTPPDGAFAAGDAIDVGVCLRNVGTREGFVNMLAIDRDDREVDCSPGEAAVDTSCGGGLQGELSSRLQVETQDCDTGSPVSSKKLLALAAIPESMVTVSPGQDRHVCLQVTLDGTDPAVQSDQVTWRFAFDLLDCVQLDDEPNGSALTAGAIPFDSDVVGSLCEHDVDVYRFTSDAAFRATVAFEHDDGDVDVVLIDSTGTEVARSDGSTDFEVIEGAVAPGTYYLQVFGFRGLPNPRYTVHLSYPHE